MHGTVKISYMKDLVSADTRARPEITSNGGGGGGYISWNKF